MVPEEKFEEQQLPGNADKIGDELEVIVAEVFNPSKFYIQLKGLETSLQLEALMDDMEEFYDK